MCVCVSEREREREREGGMETEKERDGLGVCTCVCVRMVYDYMSSVEHINHSCKRKPRRDEKFLPRARRRQKVTLNVRTQAENLMLSRYASYERNGVHHFHLGALPHPSHPPAFPPSPTLRPRCHGCARTESNGRMGPDK